MKHISMCEAINLSTHLVRSKITEDVDKNTAVMAAILSVAALAEPLKRKDEQELAALVVDAGVYIQLATGSRDFWASTTPPGQPSMVGAGRLLPALFHLVSRCLEDYDAADYQARQYLHYFATVALGGEQTMYWSSDLFAAQHLRNQRGRWKKIAAGVGYVRPNQQ